MKLVEGIILIVVWGVVDGVVKKVDSVDMVLENVLFEGQKLFDQMFEMFFVFKQVGVIDLGGQGYFYIVQGLFVVLWGDDLFVVFEIMFYVQQQFENEEFGFCIEFLMSEVMRFIEEICEFVSFYGDLLFVVGVEGYVKGYIYINEFDVLFVIVGCYGWMFKMKVEDMFEQYIEILGMMGVVVWVEEEILVLGLVVVVNGYGLVKQFWVFGVCIVLGGQIVNLSVQDIVDVVCLVSVEKVVILFNNKNVLMVVEKVMELMEGCVVVVFICMFGQGLGVVFVFILDMSVEEFKDIMIEVVQVVIIFEVMWVSCIINIIIKDGCILVIVEGDVIGL